MAYKKTYNPCDECSHSFSKNNQESNVCKICEFKQLLSKPEADVVEVKHGEWEEWYPPKEYILTGEEMLYRCSNCDAKYSDVEGYKFCPFCGAKMDGGKAE